MRIATDQSKCCGSGQCALVAPEVFDQRDDDGIVIVLHAEPAAEHHEAARQAAQVCPAAAITVLE